jgi:hypothetical protein
MGLEEWIAQGEFKCDKGAHRLADERCRSVDFLCDVLDKIAIARDVGASRNASETGQIESLGSPRRRQSLNDRRPKRACSRSAGHKRHSSRRVHRPRFESVITSSLLTANVPGTSRARTVAIVLSNSESTTPSSVMRPPFTMMWIG